MTDSYLVQLGFARSGNKSSQIFESIFPDILQTQYDCPSQFIATHWEVYQQKAAIERYDNSVNGRVFEYLLGILLYREKIQPLFLGAKVAFVPNVIFDFMLYETGKGPVCISAKTTLRERYKQADLEAFALKNVHRKARSYLVTLSSSEAASVKEKIQTGDVLGLNDVICADTAEFDQLVEELKGMTFEKPRLVEVITATALIDK